MLRASLTCSLDNCQFFTQPVTPYQAPDYLHFVKNPMDLGTLSKLINTHQVVTLQDFKVGMWLTKLTP